MTHLNQIKEHIQFHEDGMITERELMVKLVNTASAYLEIHPTDVDPEAKEIDQ